jgi:hypothetical protein
MFILIYIALFALISSCIWTKMSNTGRAKNNFAVSLIAFYQGYYFVLSLMKLFFGEYESTLLESFWDVTSITYIHYGIPLVVMCVLIPIIIRKITIFNDGRFLVILANLVCIEVVLAALPTGKISNEVYCIGFLVTVIISAVISFVYKKAFVFYTTSEYKTGIINMLPLIIGVILTNGLFLPNELYLGNSAEFTGTYGSFIAILLITSVFITALIILLELLIMPKGLGCFINRILAGLAIVGYIQNVFLNGKLDSLDGDIQEWSLWTKIINVLVWLLILGSVLFAGYVKKSLLKAVKVICIYIVLIQLVSGLYLFATTDVDNEKIQMALTNEGSLDVADGKNVIVFVMDRFDSSWMQALCDENMEFFEPLSDFTFYNNATSEFANTGTGIPYLLTGADWIDGNDSSVDYVKYAYNNSDLLKSLKYKGFDLGIYTEVSFVCDDLYGEISNFGDDIEVKYNIINTCYTMWKTSLYKTVPFGFKNLFVYYSDDINEIVENENVWNTENDYPFCESVFKEGLQLSNEYESAFRFYHMHGAHEPYTLSEDLKFDSTSRGITLNGQIKGCFNIIFEYLAQLKELGIYDEATIIITADHGQQLDFQVADSRPNFASSPVIIIKRAGSQGDVMQISSAPVTQDEMIATLAQEAGIDYYKYGVTLEEIHEEDDRERVFVKYYPEYIKYTINGNVHDLSSWYGERLDN